MERKIADQKKKVEKNEKLAVKQEELYKSQLQKRALQVTTFFISRTRSAQFYCEGFVLAEAPRWGLLRSIGFGQNYRTLQKKGLAILTAG